jgi:hypothetical protein
MVDRVILGQVLLQVLQFFSVSILPPVFQAHSFSLSSTLCNISI